jgi:hypothetical protein
VQRMRQPHHDPQGRLRLLHRLRGGGDLRLTGAGRGSDEGPVSFPGPFSFTIGSECRALVEAASGAWFRKSSFAGCCGRAPKMPVFHPGLARPAGSKMAKRGLTKVMRDPGYVVL